MSKSMERKMKRLRRGHIWPSVVLLIGSFFLVIFVSVLFMSLTVAYLAKDRVDSAYNEAQLTAQMLVQEQSGDGTERILQFLQNTPGYSEAVYILDEDKNILSGFGDATYQLDKCGDLQLPGSAEIMLYADSRAKYNIFDQNGGVDFSGFIENQFQEGALGEFAEEGMAQGSREVLYEVPFWIAVSGADRSTVMVKCRIEFYREDFWRSFFNGLLSGIFMFLPVVVLTINLIINVVNQKRMTRLLYTDTVTGGKSWLYFEHQADKVLRAGGNAGKLYALVDVTLMRYRGYCTCHGVKAGEELLERIDRQLSARMKSGECCALYGKSSFALLLKAKDRETCRNRVDALLEELFRSFEHGGMVFHAGIYFEEPWMKEGRKTVSRRKNVNVAESYNRASAARASLTDENQTAAAVFDQKLLEEQLWEHKVEDKMQHALEQEEFQVYLQPKYNPVTEKLVGAEALVRWINEEDGFISPGRFIPIFEKNGFITKLDDYMISHVAKMQAEWLKAGKEVVPISVNVSRAHFANPDLAQHICRLVDAYQVPHHLIEIELTESAFFDDKAALLGTVRKLKELGFDISMDDFGAGYSSLNSLKDLPLDVLKLDAEFFRGEDGEERGEIVVSQAIDLAKKLNMRIVAEGVEKKNQVEFLAAHDCDMIQGFYFAKPMPAGEYEERLEKKG